MSQSPAWAPLVHSAHAWLPCFTVLEKLKGESAVKGKAIGVCCSAWGWPCSVHSLVVALNEIVMGTNSPGLVQELLLILPSQL